MVIFHSKLLVYQRVVAMDISIAGWTWLTTAVVWEAPAKLEVGKRPRGVRANAPMFGWNDTHTEKQILLTLKTCCGLYGNLDLWNQEIWNQPIDPQNSWEDCNCFWFWCSKALLHGAGPQHCMWCIKQSYIFHPHKPLFSDSRCYSLLFGLRGNNHCKTFEQRVFQKALSLFTETSDCSLCWKLCTRKAGWAWVPSNFAWFQSDLIALEE